MTGQIAVASDEGTYAIRMTGDVRMVLCLSFDKFIQSMFADPDFDAVVFDLTHADAVDSTTLGLMAKIALKCRQVGVPKPVLVAESRGMVRLLETMGFEEIFVISNRHQGDMIDTKGLDCEEGSEDNFKQRVIDAHKVLMSLNEHNKQAFRELVENLEKN